MNDVIAGLTMDAKIQIQPNTYIPKGLHPGLMLVYT